MPTPWAYVEKGCKRISAEKRVSFRLKWLLKLTNWNSRQSTYREAVTVLPCFHVFEYKKSQDLAREIC
jgi:hypothetical protein